MPRYEITSPDGKRFEITAPEGATQDQVLSYAQGQFKTEKSKPTTNVSVGSRILQGMRDPIDASAQLLTKALPQGVVDTGNRINNWLARNTGLVGELPAGGVDEQVRANEDIYQSSRKKAGNEGIDWARMGGNILSPANLAIASKIPVGASTIGKIGTSVAGGGAFGALSTPVTTGTPDEFWEEKGKNAALGAGLSAALPVGAAMINPNVRQNVRTLMQEGVTPTPGQILGGRAQTIEDKLTSVPILGDAISSSRGKALDEFNRAALARALKPIGEKTDDIGREGVAAVRGKLRDAYDNLLPNLSFKADQQLATELQAVRQMAATLPPQQAQQFENILRTNLVGKMTPQGLMNGSRFKEVESDLTRIAKGYMSDPAFDNRQLGSAVGEVNQMLRAALVRSNPQQAQELKAINTGYANYARLRDAASRQGATDGRFTPAQLSSAVRSGDKTVGKRAYSEGTALMQDLTDAGRDVLMSKYPDSGSIGRLLMGAGLGGGGAMVSPAAAMAGGAATLPYLPGGRQLAAALLASRPQGAETAANAVRQIGPYITPAMIQALQGGGQ